VDEERIWNRVSAAGGFFFALAALGLAFSVPVGLLIFFSSRLDFDLDFKGFGNIPSTGPPSGTDLHGLDATTGHERWHNHLDDEFSVAGVDSGNAVVLEDDGTLHGIDGRTGRERWSHNLGTDADVPVIGDELVLAVDQKNTVHAFDVRSGRTRWHRKLTGHSAETLAVAGGIGVVTEQGAAVGLDVATGNERWRAPLTRGHHAAAGYGSLLFVRSGYHALVALDTTTGAAVWTFEAPLLNSSVDVFASLIQAEPIVGGPVVGVTLLDPQTPPTSTAALPTTSTVFLDALTGQERWRTMSGALSSFSFSPQSTRLYEYGEARMLIARDPFTGELLGQFNSAYGRLLATGGSVFSADDDVRAFDGSTGAFIWSSRSVGTDAAAVGLTDGAVIVVSTEST
jgi:outer membrane protein assembly factor BamB